MSPNGLRRWRRYAKKCRYRSRKEGKVSNATGASLRALFFAARIHPNYAVPPKPLTARSLVGMTMGARKRRSRAVAYLVIVDVTFIEHAETWANTDHSKLFRQRKFPRHQWDLEQYNQVRAQYRIGERLRPCPGCCSCKSHMLKLRELKRAYPATAKQHPQHLRRIIERRSWRCGVMVMHDGADSSDHLHRTDVHCDGSGVLPARRP